MVRSDVTPSLSSMSSLSGSKVVVAAQAGIDNFDANVFSPTKKRRIEFIPTSVSRVCKGDVIRDNEEHSVVVVEKVRGTHLTFDESDNGTERTETEASVYDEPVAEHNIDSQSSWRFEDQFMMNPKTAT